MMMNRTPTENTNTNFSYLQNPEAKLIAKEINYYEKDHNWRGTMQRGFWNVKSYMTFSENYFDVKKLPNMYDYNSVYERRNITSITLHF